MGYLTATRYIGSDGRKSIWEAACLCGNTVCMPGSELLKQLKKGVLASCGCRRRESISARLTRHGMTNHPAHKVWTGMIKRCCRPSHPAYANYGGRGISVCEKWRNSFEAFWADMGPSYAPGKSLDRINNSKGYGP